MNFLIIEYLKSRIVLNQFTDFIIMLKILDSCKINKSILIIEYLKSKIVLSQFNYKISQK